MATVIEGGSKDCILKEETIQKILDSLSPNKKIGLKELLEKECKDYQSTKVCAQKYCVEPVYGKSGFSSTLY